MKKLILLTIISLVSISSGAYAQIDVGTYSVRTAPTIVKAPTTPVVAPVTK